MSKSLLAVSNLIVIPSTGFDSFVANRLNFRLPKNDFVSARTNHL